MIRWMRSTARCRGKEDAPYRQQPRCRRGCERRARLAERVRRKSSCETTRGNTIDMRDETRLYANAFPVETC
jgi:hypothetical protein